MGALVSNSFWQLMDSLDLSSIRFHKCQGRNDKSDKNFGISMQDLKSGYKGPHSHQHFEIQYVLEGDYNIRADEAEASIYAYDIVLYSPGCVHSSTFKKRPAGIVIWFDAAYDAQSVPGLTSVPDSCGSTRCLFELVYRESHDMTGMNEALLNQLIATILLYLRKLAKSAQAHTLSDMLQTTINYIDLNYNLNITVTQLAEMINISKSYYHKLFHEQTGCSPVQYLNRARVSNAKRILEGTGMSVVDVSEAVGFDDARYFARIFKQQTGVTPRQWRADAPASARSNE